MKRLQDMRLLDIRNSVADICGGLSVDGDRAWVGSHSTI